MCCYIGIVEHIVVIEAACSALEGSERQYLMGIGCEDSDGIARCLAAWYDLMIWFPHENGGAFPVV